MRNQRLKYWFKLKNGKLIFQNRVWLLEEVSSVIGTNNISANNIKINYLESDLKNQVFEVQKKSSVWYLNFGQKSAKSLFQKMGACAIAIVF